MNSKFFVLCGVMVAILSVVCASAIGGTYAYSDECPSGYTLIEGTNQCRANPKSSCEYGDYDESKGVCLSYQSCPSGYSLVGDNQCSVSPSLDYSCPGGKGQYDSDEDWCSYSLTCPIGYRLDDDNNCVLELDVCPNSGSYDNGKCIIEIYCPYMYVLTKDNCCVAGPEPETKECTHTITTPDGFSILDRTDEKMRYYYESEVSCQYGNYVDGVCSYSLTPPTGYRIFEKTNNTIYYEADPVLDYRCPSGGSYNESSKKCESSLTTPSGYQIYSQSNNSMVYSGNVQYSCSNGGTYNSSDGMCYYQLADSGDDNTDDDNNNGNDNENNDDNIEVIKKYNVYFESLDEDYLNNPILLKNDAIMIEHYVSNITSDLFDLSIYSADSDNYEFKYWSSGDCDDANAILTGTITLVNETTNVYACWEQKVIGEQPEKFDVIFELDGGILYVDNNETTLLSYKLSEVDFSRYVAQKSNHSFLGWSITENNCINANTVGLMEITDNTKLYACYKNNIEQKVENPKTGKSSLYLIFVFGCLSLAVVIYYSRKFIKE